jgi:hypothetical protein
MFKDSLGFNPFDKNNNVYATGYSNSRLLFLNSFKQNNIYCYNGDPRKKISSMAHVSNLNDAIKANIDNGSDVYFYVNGGRKLYAIDQFTCCFCDMDAGRDSEGKYFKPSIVMQHKKKFLEKINHFSVRPSWVVDTRNGYQCYWIFDDESRELVGKNKTYWNGLQKKLVNYFNGDPRAIKANQIYRVPYTWWRKNWENKASYFTSILPGSNGDTINVGDLRHALTGQTTNIIVDPSKCSDEWYKGYAKAYNKADQNGIPVSKTVSKEIINNLQNDCHYKFLDNNDTGHAYGDGVSVKPWPRPNRSTEPQDASSDESINLDGSQTKLLKTVVEFLNQVSTPLYFSNNRFLSGAAKDLANKLSDQFCIG